MTLEDTSTLEGLLENVPEFESRQVYLDFCNSLVRAFKSKKGNESASDTEFNRHLRNITHGIGNIIKTGWGGVDIISYDHPEVDKYLVVSSGKFLAFEKHDEKVETLKCEEGAGVLVYRPLEAQARFAKHVGASSQSRYPLQAELIKPGWTITLQPGQEHTIIALSNLLVRENSQDFKGMDQDLIFIYMPLDE